MEIVISEFMDKSIIDNTHSKIKLLYDPDLVDNRDRLKKVLSKAKALVVRNRTQVDRELLDAAPHLAVVGRLGVGLDNIDIEECRKRGIAVYPATGANAVAVAEYVICSMMMLIRKAYSSKPQMLGGEWPRNQLIGNETSGKTLGLLGFGGIAKETASRAIALGMRVIAFDPYLPKEDPSWEQVIRIENQAELLRQSDVISLHVPLSKTTYHLINADSISQMKSGAIVINTARGGIVDEKALVKALTSGRLGGAALDVFETEPLDEETASSFSTISNLILTPHIAGVTIESNVRVSRMTIDKVCNALEAAKCQKNTLP
ncbi:MAG: 3-phosphoglycerate dehydrogenase [Desulfobulbus propionicus]|nr:MAG: 3-phosphoglycerate dehydrogenase [Desulfobulbus propionicus]